MLDETKTVHDDFALEPVPEHARKGMLSMSMVMLGFTFFAASMWVGGSLGVGFRLWPDLVIVVMTGNAILGFYGALLSYASARTNLSIHTLSRHAFGTQGSKLPSLMLALTQIGWFGVGVVMLAKPVQIFTGTPMIYTIIIGGAFMTLTVYIGMEAIEWVSKIAVPAIIVLGVMSMYRAITGAGGIDALMAIEPQKPLSFATGVAMGVGSFISGATVTPDFTRFSKNTKVAMSATISAFIFGNALMFFFGAFGALATGVADTSEVLAAQGLMGAGIALLALNIWTTNDNALYASGLGLSNITGLPRKKLTLLAGFIGTLLSVYLYNNFVGWLTMLSIALPPVGGIIIGDYYLKSKCEYPDFKTHAFKEINWAAILAMIVACLVGKFSPSSGIFSIGSINSIVVAAVVFLVADKLLYKE